MIRPMPSPNGTNHEQLYILRGRANPAGAYDAAPDNLARAHADEEVLQLAEWCRKNLRPEQIIALTEQLQTELSGRPEKYPDERQAQDSIRGLARSIGIDNVGVQPQPRRVSSQSMQGFYDRFPEAARIGINR
ncbi:hypothetical protein AMST5_02153 [freshwater sediment metagenome]|uniref:Uncharacterized protein n=1 Tax=freshwater sediment metagenome TaxID=556182 RepID=A0AA48LZG5_9ZZZZ